MAWSIDEGLEGLDHNILTGRVPAGAGASGPSRNRES